MCTVGFQLFTRYSVKADTELLHVKILQSSIYRCMLSVMWFYLYTLLVNTEKGYTVKFLLVKTFKKILPTKCCIYIKHAQATIWVAQKLQEHSVSLVHCMTVCSKLAEQDRWYFFSIFGLYWDICLKLPSKHLHRTVDYGS